MVRFAAAVTHDAAFTELAERAINGAVGADQRQWEKMLASAVV